MCIIHSTVHSTSRGSRSSSSTECSVQRDSTLLTSPVFTASEFCNLLEYETTLRRTTDLFPLNRIYCNYSVLEELVDHGGAHMPASTRRGVPNDSTWADSRVQSTTGHSIQYSSASTYDELVPTKRLLSFVGTLARLPYPLSVHPFQGRSLEYASRVSTPQ